MAYHNHHTADALWCQSRLWNGLGRGRQARFLAPLFTRPRSGAAGTDGGTIEPPLFPIKQTVGIKCVTQGHQHRSKAAVLTPAPIAIVDGLPRAVALGNITPLGAGVQLPEQAVQDTAMVCPRMAASRAWLWQIGFEQQILLISQFVSAHQHISFLRADTLLLQVVCHRYQVPGQNLAILRRLAQVGDIGGLRERLAYIEELGPEYQPFVAELRRLAGKYHTSAIETVLERYDALPKE